MYGCTLRAYACHSLMQVWSTAMLSEIKARCMAEATTYEERTDPIKDHCARHLEDGIPQPVWQISQGLEAVEHRGQSNIKSVIPPRLMMQSPCTLSKSWSSCRRLHIPFFGLLMPQQTSVRRG